MSLAISIASGPRHCDAEMPQPIISSSGAKSVIEVYNQQQVATCERFIAQAAQAAQAAIVDADSCRRAEGVLIGLSEAVKMVEARRLELKKPITQTGKAIDAIAAKLSEPLDAAKETLRSRIFAFRNEERARAEKARLEAEAKARAERLAAEAAARAKAEADAQELAEVLGEHVEPAAPEPVLPAPPVPVAPAPAPAPSVVVSRKIPDIEIVDASLIPYRIGETVLMHPDHAAIKRIVGLGVQVPGVRAIEREQLALNGRRP